MTIETEKVTYEVSSTSVTATPGGLSLDVKSAINFYENMALPEISHDTTPTLNTTSARFTVPRELRKETQDSLRDMGYTVEIL